MQKLAEINWNDLIKGEGPSDYIPSHGFSPTGSYGLNMTKTRGKVYFTEPDTDRGGATLTDDVIAMAYDKTLSGNDAYILDDGGAVYTLAAGTLTKRQTITADTFIVGTSDLLQYESAVGSPFLFATSQTRIIRFTGPNLDGAAPDTDFWSGLNTGVRHPLERVEDKLYIGDFNLIHAYDGTTTTSAEITLPPYVNITSLRKHPDGRTLLAFCGISQNFGHTRGGGGRVYYIDTILKDWTREVVLESQVEGTRVVGGTIYVTYGDNLGYFDGNGLQFLKKLTIPSTDSTTTNATYSHCMASMEDILIVRNDTQVIAYGDLGAGKVFWKSYTGNARTLTCVFYLGDNKMLYAYQTSGSVEKLVEVDYDNIGVNGAFTTNHYFFGQMVQIKRIIVLHDVTNSAGTSRFQIESRKHSGGSTSIIEDRTYTNQNTNRSRFNVDIKTDVFQLYFAPTTDDIGITAIMIYGDILPV